MPPKRKTARGGGRPKRPREPSPVAKDSEGQIQKRQRIDNNSAAAVPQGTKKTSLNVPDKRPLGGEDEDADGEDDKRDENVGESHVPTHPDVDQGHEEEQNMEHEIMKEDGEDSYKEDEEDNAEPQPQTSTRGRGRGRGRRARGAGAGQTRSSPRKVIHQSQAQSMSNTSSVRGRKPARGRGKGIVVSNPPPIKAPVAEEVGARFGGEGGPETNANEGDKEGEGRKEGEAEVPQHPPLSQPSSPPQQFQEDHSQQQQSNQIPGADHSLHPTPASFASHPHPYYPTYPVHPPFQYTYVTPPIPPAPDGRPYLPLRPDGTQPIYGTSFATTVGTANGTGSASSSFNAPYPASGAAAQSLDANAPQGNPFPPSAPIPVPAYGTAVYGVGASDDDDDDQEQGQGQISGSGDSMAPGKRKAQPAVKAGGRAGRGDHVACHFCRGRKLKCDGRRPTCGHCALRSLACKYDDAVRRRGPGRKEKNNRRERNGAGDRKAGGVIVSDLSVGPQTPTPSHSQITTPSTEGVKRKRRPPIQPNHSQTSILRFDDADGTAAPGPGMKPAPAAYGVNNNERLGYYYAGGPQYGPPYPPYASFDEAGNPHPHPPQAAYGYAQDGREEEGDGNAEMDGDGDGDGDHEVYGSRPEEDVPYGQPPNESYSNAWPAEPPGGVPVSHPHAQHM